MPKRTKKAAPVKEKPRTRASEVREWIAGFRAVLVSETPDPRERLLRLAERWNNATLWSQWQESQQEWQRAKERIANVHRVCSNRAAEMFVNLARQATEQERAAHCEFWRLQFELNELQNLLRELRPELLADFGPPVMLQETITPNERAAMVNRVWAKLLEATPAGETAPPPLSRNQTAVLEILKAMKPGRGIDGKALIRRLREEKITVSQAVLTKHVMPILKVHFKVTNKRGIGYFIAR